MLRGTVFRPTAPNFNHNLYMIYSPRITVNLDLYHPDFRVPSLIPSAEHSAPTWLPRLQGRSNRFVTQVTLSPTHRRGNNDLRPILLLSANSLPIISKTTYRAIPGKDLFARRVIYPVSKFSAYTIKPYVSRPSAMMHSCIIVFVGIS